MLRELSAGLEQISHTDGIKIILLEAAGRIFCAGMDVGEYTPERAFLALDAFHSVCTSLLEASQPVVVVVNGPAIGGGAELAAFGDLVIATPRARFALPEITIGIFPSTAATMLPLIVGPKLALELVLTGEAITAERACELGLVNRLVPRSAARNRRRRVAGPPHRAIRSGDGRRKTRCARRTRPFPARRDAFLARCVPKRAVHLEDSREGLRALIEKRKPLWKNR